MVRHNRLFDKAITVLGRSGYTEGSYTDLNIRRFIQYYGHPQSKDLEHNYGNKMQGKLQKPDWPPMGKFSHPL